MGSKRRMNRRAAAPSSSGHRAGQGDQEMKANVAVAALCGVRGASVLAALALTLSTAAWAQEAPPPPPPDQSAPAVDQPALSPTRFRWGVGGDIGYFLPVNILDFGASARFGAQLNDL